MTARAAAREAGSKTYFTGVPCKQGHLAARATLTGTCVQCTSEATKRWAAARPEKQKEYTQEYRKRFRAKVRERDRVAQAAARAAAPEKFRAQALANRQKKAAVEGRVYRPQGALLQHEVEARLAQVHGGLLTYVSGYQNMLAHAVFRCETHGAQFTAIPHNVLRGANPCTRCNHMRSGQEEDVARLLSNYAPTVLHDRTLLRPRELDIYLPSKKLAVEYCGMYWHSAGDEEQDRTLRTKHWQKYKDCAAQGVRLITLFESEWLERKRAVARLLRNAAGKGRGKLMARKCTLAPVPHEVAVAFFERYHPQGGAGTGACWGLFWREKLVACMRFTHGINDRGRAAAKREWTLSRYATRVTVVGGASRLFEAFLKAHDPETVKSFSDNRFFDGGMYQKLGFVLEQETAPDYQVWSPKIGLRPKAAYQRRTIPARLQDHEVDDAFDPVTDSRSERDMTFLMGARRIYDCGKKRWIWHKPLDLSRT